MVLVCLSNLKICIQYLINDHYRASQIEIETRLPRKVLHDIKILTIYRIFHIPISQMHKQTEYIPKDLFSLNLCVCVCIYFIHGKEAELV